MSVFDFSKDLAISRFLEKFPHLVSINMRKSLNSVNSNKIFYFNKILEKAVFSENNLSSLPVFCQFCSSYQCRNNLLINNECKLKAVYFDSNKLKTISHQDLHELENLEYLNLNHNQISFIEPNAFFNLVKLETLLLSNNMLTLLNEDSVSFLSNLINLKELNLSSNSIRVIRRFFLSQLVKLETVDFSFNNIHSLESFSFNKLSALRNLHLNDNDPKLHLDSLAFQQLEAIQSVYIAKSLFYTEAENINSIFLNLFKFKNSKFSKSVLSRAYFKSLFLITSYDSYECELTLLFMRQNIHFNFKTETNIFDYFSECSKKSIKDWPRLANELILKDKNRKIFTNFLFYFFWLTLFLILLLGFYHF